MPSTFMRVLKTYTFVRLSRIVLLCSQPIPVPGAGNRLKQALKRNEALTVTPPGGPLPPDS